MTTTKAKVLVPEKVSPDGLALLQKTLDVHEKKGQSAEQLLEIIGEHPDLPVRSGLARPELTSYVRRL
jgi:D-3-phosphoglycerate dehydrogenase